MNASKTAWIYEMHYQLNTRKTLAANAKLHATSIGSIVLSYYVTAQRIKQSSSHFVIGPEEIFADRPQRSELNI